MKRCLPYLILALIVFSVKYSSAQCETWDCEDAVMGMWALTLNQAGTTTAVGGGLKAVGVDGAGHNGNESYCNNPVLEAVNNWHGGTNACAAYFHTDDASNTLPVVKVIHAGDGHGVSIDMSQTTSTSDAALYIDSWGVGMEPILLEEVIRMHCT